MLYTGRLIKPPTVRDKVIFFSLAKDYESAPMVCVLFRQKRAPQITTTMLNAKVNDILTIDGKIEKNPYDSKDQLIVYNIIANGVSAYQKGGVNNNYDDVEVTYPLKWKISPELLD